MINVSNGDSYKIHPAKIIKITEDYVEYEATFDANWVSGFTVTVNATDSFGNSMEIELEGEEGLMQHVTSELYQLGNSVFQGAGDAALSALHHTV